MVKSSKCSASHSCTTPRRTPEYNYYLEDSFTESSVGSNGYQGIRMDGWFFHYGNKGHEQGVLLDSSLYATPEKQSFQKQVMSNCNVTSLLLRFPEGNSPTTSLTVVERHEVGKPWETLDPLDEKEFVSFLRQETGNPLNDSDFPVQGPYRFVPIMWEDRSQYLSQTQIRQYLRTLPHFCSKPECERKYIFFDIDWIIYCEASGKYIMLEAKLESELERFWKNHYPFEEMLRLTDRCIPDNTSRVLSIFNENGSVTTQTINKGIYGNKNEIYGSYYRAGSLESYFNALKEILA